MSDEKRRPGGDKKRIKLPDGTYGVYMGQTGSGNKRKRAPKNVGQGAPTSGKGEGQGPRQNAARPRENIPGNRVAQPPARKPLPKGAASDKSKGKIPFLSSAADKIHTWWLSISIDADNIIKGVLIGAFILLFAMLQTTVFSKFSLFGATPDLMLPLVIAIAVTEGEKWGGICGLICAFLIEAIGSTATLTLLPLLYVPCGFIIGVISKIYFRDSVIVRCIYTAIATLLKCVVTVIYVVVTYKTVGAALMFREIVIPEFFSTLFMSVIPHAAVWLSMKPFHKSRAERVS